MSVIMSWLFLGIVGFLLWHVGHTGRKYLESVPTCSQSESVKTEDNLLKAWNEKEKRKA